MPTAAAAAAEAAHFEVFDLVAVMLLRVIGAGT
jgi:hypothetical protein